MSDQFPPSNDPDDEATPADAADATDRFDDADASHTTDDADTADATDTADDADAAEQAEIIAMEATIPDGADASGVEYDDATLEAAAAAVNDPLAAPEPGPSGRSGQASEPTGGGFGPPPAPDGATSGPPDDGPPPLFSPNATRSPYRRLFRSRHDRRIGGVAGGLAQYLGVDPTVVRIGFVVFALTGISILIYLAAWILVPEQPDGTPEQLWQGGGDDDRRLAMAVGVGGLGFAIAIITGSWAVLALGLVAGGVWLLSEASGPSGPPSSGSPQAPPESWAAAQSAQSTPSSQPFAAAGTSTATMAAAPPAPNWAPPQAAPARPRRPQRITRAVLSLLALLVGLGIAAAAGDWWDVSATRLFGIGLVTIGVGVALGAVTRLGARGLIPLGIVGTLLLVPVAAVDGLVDDGIGETVHRPTSIADLADEYQYGIGHFVVDLSQLDFEGRTEAVHIELGIGEVEVILPRDVGGSVFAEADAGELDVRVNTDFDRVDDGLNVDSGRITLPGDRGTLDLTVEVGLGAVDVRTR